MYAGVLGDVISIGVESRVTLTVGVAIDTPVEGMFCAKGTITGIGFGLLKIVLGVDTTVGTDICYILLLCVSFPVCAYL